MQMTRPNTAGGFKDFCSWREDDKRLLKFDNMTMIPKFNVYNLTEEQKAERAKLLEKTKEGGRLL